jgi:CBS domain-containing protein
MKVVGEVTHTEALLVLTQAVQPDLVLLDCELPGLTTIDLLPQLRLASPHLAVVALSGHLEARQKSLQAGVDAFVSKGDPPEKLLTVLYTIKNGGNKIMKQELIKDWMTKDVITISPDTTLPEAHRVMSDKQIRRLPVMDKGKLLGIVTRGDVREAEPSDATTLNIWEINYLLSQLKINRVMTPDPTTITPNATLGDAAKAMLETKISGLPVIDDQGNVVGMITESDIFRAVIQKWSQN